MMETIRFSSLRSLTRRGFFLVPLLVCWTELHAFAAQRGEDKSAAAEIPIADYASRTKGIIRALYPGLDPLPRLIVMDGRPWDDTGVMNVLYFELCNPSPQQLTDGDPCPCLNPVLKGHVLFNLVSGELISLHLTGPAATAKRDRFGDLVRSHRQWSEAQVIEALTGAGAKYGPDMKDQLIKGLPIAELRPYVGDLKVESAQLNVQKPSDWTDQVPGDLGACFWVVAVTATVPSGNKHRHYYFYFVEPFEARVISVLQTVIPMPADFPSLLPKP